jgi:predicted deacylase
MQLDLLEYAAAEAARDRGVAKVLGNNGKWSDGAMSALQYFAGACGRAFTTEEFRRAALVDAPAHPNAWGALFNGAAKRGIIRQVGWSRPSNVKSHASVVMTWECAA